MSIDKLIEEVIGREGGYVNHPNDRGGPTNWGVTQQVARAYGYTGDMRTLPREVAKAIYARRYFTDPGFDRVQAIYPRIAEEMFDTGINMGPSVAGQFLQRALNALAPHEVLLHGGVQLHGFGRGAQAAFVHVEQLQPGSRLHLRQQPADRRLGGVQQLGCRSGGAGLDDSAERLNFAGVQGPGHGVAAGKW